MGNQSGWENLYGANLGTITADGGTMDTYQALMAESRSYHSVHQ